ncbi:MAG: aminotransferase class V-fold PLP-dependent enzyme [Elainellaceae cyanobacterium]
MVSTALHQYRQQFPSLSCGHYFNFGGQGPIPQVSLEAIQAAHAQIQQLGPFSGRANQWIAKQTQRVRQAIAADLGVEPATITLTDSVTTGWNIPLWGLDWQPGDHILLTDCEHPGAIATVQELQHRFGVEVSVCPIMDTLNEGCPIDVVRSHLQPNTRLLLVSHILWNTGQVLPLESIVEVCHSHQGQRGAVMVMVDAAQSVGVLPLNLDQLGADFYTFTGHKWLCGPAGLGGLYIHPTALDAIRPTFIGWRGITKDSSGQPTGWESDGRRFEIATSAYTLYPGLTEAIALHNRWGTAGDRYRRICQLSDYLWRGLQKIPRVCCLRASTPEAGLVSFVIEPRTAPHAQIVAQLEQKDIMVRTILDPDCIRACVHYFTTEVEIDHLLKALGQILE